MFSQRTRTEQEMRRFGETLSAEYGWSNLRLTPADRGFYGETWRADAAQGCFFVKLIAYRRHIPGFLQSLAAVRRMNDMGLDFISRPVETRSGDGFTPALDGVAAAFRFEEGVHTEDYPLEKLFVRMADVYRLSTQDFELSWEQFGMNEYLGFQDALRIAQSSGAPAVKDVLRVMNAHRAELEMCAEVLRKVIPVCRRTPIHRVITSGDVGGNVLLRGDEMVIIDWDQLVIAPVERDMWFYMQDMRQIDLVNEVMERQELPVRVEPVRLAYYACSRTFFYMREYLFAAMADGGEGTAAQTEGYFADFGEKCMGRAKRIADAL